MVRDCTHVRIAGGKDMPVLMCYESLTCNTLQNSLGRAEEGTKSRCSVVWVRKLEATG